MTNGQSESYVIQKEKVRVVACTSQFKIKGNIHVVPKARITDFLNRQDMSFLPMTEVIVYDMENQELQRSNFLSLNKDKITILSVVTE